VASPPVDDFAWPEKVLTFASPPRAARPALFIQPINYSTYTADQPTPTHRTTDDVPTPTTATLSLRRSLRHAKSSPAIRTPTGPPPAAARPKLVRKTTSTASLKMALSPLLTLESQSHHSLYSEGEESSTHVKQQVVKLPSPERTAATAPRGRRTDVRQLFDASDSPSRTPAARRPPLSRSATSRRSTTFSNFVMGGVPPTRTLSAKQSLQQLLDHHPDKSRVLPFSVGLVLPAGGFRSRADSDASSSSARPPSPIPTIRVDLVS
jgi:hypothetical protein